MTKIDVVFNFDYWETPLNKMHGRKKTHTRRCNLWKRLQCKPQVYSRSCWWARQKRTWLVALRGITLKGYSSVLIDLACVECFAAHNLESGWLIKVKHDLVVDESVRQLQLVVQRFGFVSALVAVNFNLVNSGVHLVVCIHTPKDDNLPVEFNAAHASELRQITLINLPVAACF